MFAFLPLLTLGLNSSFVTPQLDGPACGGDWEPSRIFKHPFLSKEQAQQATPTPGNCGEDLVMFFTELLFVVPSKVSDVKASSCCTVQIKWTHWSISQSKALAKICDPEILLRQSMCSRAQPKASGNIFQLSCYDLKSKFCRNKGWKASSQQEMRNYSFSCFPSPPHFHLLQIIDNPTKNCFSGQKFSQEQWGPTARVWWQSEVLKLLLCQQRRTINKLNQQSFSSLVLISLPGLSLLSSVNQINY